MNCTVVIYMNKPGRKFVAHNRIDGEWYGTVRSKNLKSAVRKARKWVATDDAIKLVWQ